MAGLTVIGAHVLAPDLGVAWADSETYDEDDRPIGLLNKVFASPAGFAFVMRGWSSVAIAGGCAVMQASDFATALRRLPHVLRRASIKAVERSRHPGIYAGQHAALIGFDPAAGMTAYRFTAAEGFRAMMDDRQTAPMPEHGGSEPTGPHQVQAIAERQLLRIQERVPEATGGPLHVAVIRPDGITCNRLCDLAEFAARAPTHSSEQAA